MLEFTNIFFTQINSFVLLLFFHQVSKLISNNIKNKYSENLSFIFIITILIAIISLLFQTILFFNDNFFYANKEYLRFFILFLIYLSPIFFLF